MKQTNKKYISKEMALMAAITTESMLLHENYDAMLYWNVNDRRYTIIVEYVNDNPAVKYKNYTCSTWRMYSHKDDVKKELVLIFLY